MRIEAFRKVIDFSKMSTVFEIGGGFGVWPHLLLTMFPNVKKVAYLDIPPTLYVATQYLRHFFGDAVVDYRTTRNIDHIAFCKDDELEILCICPWQIEKLNISATVLWNTSSFSEMTPEIVHNYAKHVKSNLKDDGSSICLILSKKGRKGREANTFISTPEQVTAAFEPEYQMEVLAPPIEHPVHAQYRLGRRST